MTREQVLQEALEKILGLAVMMDGPRAYQVVQIARAALTTAKKCDICGGSINEGHICYDRGEGL
jgi:uncharacterized protein with ACT and thioredoxin-like domain